MYSLFSFWLLLLSSIIVTKGNNYGEVNYQDALLIVTTNSNSNLLVNSINIECYKCKHTDLGVVNQNQNLSIRINTDYPSYYLNVINLKNNQFVCRDFLFDFGENGTYLLTVVNSTTGSECSIATIVEPDSLYLPLIVSASVLIGVGMFYALAKFLFKKYRLNSYAHNSALNSDLGTPIMAASSTYLIDPSDQQFLSSTSRILSKNKNRMKSIDVLRGLSLAIMIFANYGSGGYSFLVSV